jgi:glycosyltransferase involved in cell wall biosynthesis
VIKLSVIIPAYNAVDFLEKCVRSIQGQDIPTDEVEVIIVNDGSKDNTLTLVDRLLAEFPNITCINQRNMGVSVARNAGIEKAQGKYLLFVDADDFVTPNFFGRVLSLAEQHELQMFWLCYRILKTDTSIAREYIYPNPGGGVLSGMDAYRIAVASEVPDPDRSCGIIYSRQFLLTNQLRYIPGVPILEDGEFISRLSCLAERCGFDSQPAYVRTTRPGSAINSNIFFSEQAVSGFLRAAVNLKQFQARPSLTRDQKMFLNQPICKFSMLFTNASFGKDGNKGLAKMTRALQASNLHTCDLTGLSEEYRSEGRIFNISPKLYAYYKKLKVKLDFMLSRVA